MSDTRRDFTLRELQGMHSKWSDANFPEVGEEKLVNAALGCAEEAGELCRAVLKGRQGIRGYDNPEHRNAQVKDAIGDIVVYAMSACEAEGWQLQDVLEWVLNDVVTRQWVKDPQRGGIR